MSEALFESDIPELALLSRGKVRDIYHCGPDHLVIVTSDRLSAFDVVLPEPIPGKGEVLTRVANFWFDRTRHIIPNHLSDLPLSSAVTDSVARETLGDRAIVVRKFLPLPVEAIVRGYIIGSGWKEYQKSGAVCSIQLPQGLRQADKIPDGAIFTPSTKAAAGDHDENISYDKATEVVFNFLCERSVGGSEQDEHLGYAAERLMSEVRDASLRIYTEAAQYALERGIIIADTKFEFGLDPAGRLNLIDEVLTPDSSRFWPADQYQPGASPPSFDKQFVRDYLETLDWDKTPPGPTLPEEVIEKTAEKYREAERRLTGK